MICKPLALCHISHIGAGEHPPNFAVMRLTDCEACRRWRRKGRQGAEAAHLSRGATVPLSPATNIFPFQFGTSNEDRQFL